MGGTGTVFPACDGLQLGACARLPHGRVAWAAKRGAEVPTQSAQLLQVHHPSVATLRQTARRCISSPWTMRALPDLPGPVGTPPGVVTSALSLSFPVAILVSADDSQLAIVDYGDAGASRQPVRFMRGPSAARWLAWWHHRAHLPDGRGARRRPAVAVHHRTRPAECGGEAMLWQVPLSGGDAVLLYHGAPLSQPIGLALSSDNTLYVADAQGAQGQGGAIFVSRGDRLLQINKQPLALTYPSGLCAAGRGSTDLLFTTTIATGTEPWLRRISPNGRCRTWCCLRSPMPPVCREPRRSIAGSPSMQSCRTQAPPLLRRLGQVLTAQCCCFRHSHRFGFPDFHRDALPEHRSKADTRPSALTTQASRQSASASLRMRSAARAVARP